MSGAAVMAGQFGLWTPIGAEQVGSGYQVAWQFGTADQYIVWTLDSSGNFLSQGAVTSGNSLALESLEASFQQNLNNDLTTGIVTTVIESNGSTSLVQVADNYFLYPVGGSSGPQLRFGGAAVTTGEFGAWTPIGAEQTASGYQVAWKFGSADQYVVWTTDVSGNYLSQSAVVSGHSLALESLEAGFQQDLNNDLTTGIVTTVIEFAWIDQPGSGGGQLFSLSGRRVVGPSIERVRRAGGAWRIRHVQPDCRGSDGQRL